MYRFFKTEGFSCIRITIIIALSSGSRNFSGGGAPWWGPHGGLIRVSQRRGPASGFLGPSEDFTNFHKNAIKFTMFNQKFFGFLPIFNENFSIFSKLTRNFAKILLKILKNKEIRIQARGEAPRCQRIFQKLRRRINGNVQYLENFHKLCENF